MTLPDSEVQAGFPERFGCLYDARSFSQEFFSWYNSKYRHSGLGLLSLLWFITVWRRRRSDSGLPPLTLITTLIPNVSPASSLNGSCSQGGLDQQAPAFPRIKVIKIMLRGVSNMLTRTGLGYRPTGIGREDGKVYSTGNMTLAGDTWLPTATVIGSFPAASSAGSLTLT